MQGTNVHLFTRRSRTQHAAITRLTHTHTLTQTSFSCAGILIRGETVRDTVGLWWVYWSIVDAEEEMWEEMCRITKCTQTHTHAHFCIWAERWQGVVFKVSWVEYKRHCAQCRRQNSMWSVCYWCVCLQRCRVSIHFYLIFYFYGYHHTSFLYLTLLILGIAFLLPPYVFPRLVWKWYL